jgi:hypothetical protein
VLDASARAPGTALGRGATRGPLDAIAGCDAAAVQFCGRPPLRSRSTTRRPRVRLLSVIDGAAGPGLESRVALGPVAGDELVDPAPMHP